MRCAILVFAIGVMGNWGSCLAGTLYLNPMFGVQKTSNLIYGTSLVNNGGSSIDLKLDIYQPTDIGTPVPSSRPTVMYIHGGGWQGGNKNSVPQSTAWVSRGYNVVSINYRLLGDNPPLTTGLADDFAFLAFLGPPGIISEVNASLEDARLAMEWMYDNAATYGIDPNRIGLAGSSAGAVMSLALAHIEPSKNIQPRAVLSSVGALFNDPSPYSSGGPPTMLIAGETDTTVPAFVVEYTSELMTDAGIHNELYVQPNTGHQTNWNMVFDGETLSQHGINFLHTHLATVPEPSTAVLAGIGAMVFLLGVRRKLMRE